MNYPPPVLSLFPFVLSLSKDLYRREMYFDKLSTNGFSRREVAL